MSTTLEMPVIEAILQWFETAINGITADAGYSHTLTARRPKRTEIDREQLADGLVFIAQSDGKTESRECRASGAESNYETITCQIIATDLGGDVAVSVDTRLNFMAADLAKVIMQSNTAGAACGGYAVSVDLVDWAFGDTDSASFKTLAFGVRYAQQWANHYVQE
jgi:hypothetical protein